MPGEVPHYLEHSFIPHPAPGDLIPHHLCAELLVLFLRAGLPADRSGPQNDRNRNTKARSHKGDEPTNVFPLGVQWSTVVSWW